MANQFVQLAADGAGKKMQTHENTVNAQVVNAQAVVLVDAAGATLATVPTSLGNSTGKTNVGQTGTLASSAATADQVIRTYTVTAGKTFYLCWLAVNARLTTFAATATNFGEASLESPAGTKLLTTMIAGSGIGDRDYLVFTEPVPIAAGTVIRMVCTPAAATAMTWRANFGGYEK